MAIVVCDHIDDLFNKFSKDLHIYGMDFYSNHPLRNSVPVLEPFKTGTSQIRSYLHGGTVCLNKSLSDWPSFKLMCNGSSCYTFDMDYNIVRIDKWGQDKRLYINCCNGFSSESPTYNIESGFDVPGYWEVLRALSDVSKSLSKQNIGLACSVVSYLHVFLSMFTTVHSYLSNAAVYDSHVLYNLICEIMSCVYSPNGDYMDVQYSTASYPVVTVDVVRSCKKCGYYAVFGEDHISPASSMERPVMYVYDNVGYVFENAVSDKVMCCIDLRRSHLLHSINTGLYPVMYEYMFNIICMFDLSLYEYK